VWLPPALFTENASAAMKDRMPYVADSPDGPMWVAKSGAKFGLAGGMGSSGKKYVKDYSIRADLMAAEGLYNEASRDSHRVSDPDQRVKDQDRDGIQAEVVYGILKAAHILNDPEAAWEMNRVYNDFLSSFCKTYPDRLIGLAVILGTDVDLAVQEVKRVAALGLKGIELSITANMVPLFDLRWEPLWSALEESGMPIHFHGTPVAFNWPTRPDHWSDLEFAVANATYVANTQMGAHATLGAMIYGGQLERHPKLQVVLGESGIGWIPFYLDRLDYEWEESFHKQLDLKMKPSDYWRRQCHATFQYEKSGAHMLDLLGDETIMWASDFPHPQGVWPDSQEFIQKQFGNLSPEVRHKIIAGNAAKVYGLSN
jgi:predicted TIM-barrel fold metal-dependent hydrolase